MFLKSLTNKIWGVLSTTLIVASCYFTNSPPEIYAASVIGILFVLCVANGKAIGNLLGAALALMYAYLSYKSGFFGNSVINLYFIFPMQLLAFFVWRKYKGALSLPKGAGYLMAGLFVVASFVSVRLAINSGSSMPLHDGISSILLIFATVLLTLKVKEQWYAWIPYNAIEVLMWFAAASLHPEMLAIFVMRSVFFINSLIGFYNWRKNLV